MVERTVVMAVPSAEKAAALVAVVRAGATVVVWAVTLVVMAWPLAV